MKISLNILSANVLLPRHTSPSLARNTLWAFVGYILRLLLQAVYFVMIARCLGVKEYGAFIAVCAMASLVAPFVSMGSGVLLIKNVSRDNRQFPMMWGNCLVLTVATGIVIALAAIAGSLIWLPRSIPILALALICTADLVFVRVLDMAAAAFQAFALFAMNARLNVLLSAARLCGLVVLTEFIRKPTVLAWSGVYLAAAAVSAAAGLILVKSRLGSASPELRRVRSELKEGFYFAVGNSALTAYNDIDKAMMARLATLEGTGIYGAAYRLVDVSLIPVRALLNAAYPEFFRKGVSGLHSTLKYGHQMFLRALPYALLAMTGLFLGAPIVPHVLGREYGNVTAALRWLSPLPLLKILQLFVADSLTGAGYQGWRTAAQAFVAVVNILANIWAIPAYGWRGAAFVSLLSDGLLVVALWLIAFGLSRTVPVREAPELLLAGAGMRRES